MLRTASALTTLAIAICSHVLPLATAERQSLLTHLEAPLLFVKRHSYRGIHIYDTYYKWVPGGGIYVLENPSAPAEERRIRAVIDPTTPDTLGEGIYSDPELSWDGRHLLFCFKPDANGSTSIYEIGIDGKGLRRLTDPRPCCGDYRGSRAGVHDVSPAYLPDGRIVFTSTRQHGLVPCANKGVDILHVMNADGTDIRPISVNNVNEFDPCVMPDGRVLFGRWEYVDKTALTQQSLWTVFPDSTNETALFANNMVHPEALLDARPVPGLPHLIAAALTPHNAPPRGTVAIVDTRVSKNSPEAIANFEHPDSPTHDRGNSCEPWPLAEDVILFSGRPKGAKYNAIEIVDRRGRREVVFADPSICCHSPMVVKPRPRPAVLPTTAPHTSPVEDRPARGRMPALRGGAFYVQDIYAGLTGIKRGEVKWLRVIDETSRVSATPGGAMNQTFLMSGVLAWSAKVFLGVVPVRQDGSAYFEAPSRRAIYLQALDAEGRQVQSMRTFVQAVPGVTRSCIGCHEHKYTAPTNIPRPETLGRKPDRLRPESWGSGFIDFPSMVQPIFDKHCIGCHGGEKGISAGLDLTGGWTEYFSISYENLISRRETQLTAHLIAGIDCMNGTSRWSASIRPPRFHGSGAAPLAEVLASGHEGRIPRLTRTERDLTMAWIDTNGLFHGTWDYTKHGCRVRSWPHTKSALVAKMREAGCTRCHETNQEVLFESDWFNLQRPELSRILRAPLGKGAAGYGLGLCRDRKVDPQRQRIQILVGGRYQHRDLPVDQFKVRKLTPRDTSGEPVIAFASTDDPHYRAMLDIVRDGSKRALAAPRVDMPGAEILPGRCRQFQPPPLPEPAPVLEALVDGESIVHLRWERSARTIGLSAELHRGKEADFGPGSETLLTATRLFAHSDLSAPFGEQHYVLVLRSGTDRSAPIRATVPVPPPQPPPTPRGLEATPAPGRVALRWQACSRPNLRYNVYRTEAGATTFQRLSPEPSPELSYVDAALPEGVTHAYTVRAVNRRGIESPAASIVEAAPLPEIRDPVFVASFAQNADALLHAGGSARGVLHGKARVVDGALDLRKGGHVTFDSRPELGLDRRLSVECWVHFVREEKMPVVLSCGHWRRAGWFLQRIGRGWRWHVGGVSCDGGRPAPGRWTHLIGTFDGRTARLYQDGQLTGEKACDPIRTPWRGQFYVGQYSGGPSAPYQVIGWISGVEVYNRALSAKDASAAFADSPVAVAR